MKQEEWEKICGNMEALFRMGKFESGAIAGIQAISAHLAKHYPARGENKNELPDGPIVL